MTAVSAEVVTLEAIADEVRSQIQRYREAEDLAYEAQLATGRLLAQARHMFPSDQAFGAWFRAQEFGFTDRWARTLRKAAEHEEQVREFVVGSQLPTGAKPNIDKALKAICPPSPRTPKHTRVEDVGISTPSCRIEVFPDSEISLRSSPDEVADDSGSHWCGTCEASKDPDESRQYYECANCGATFNDEDNDDSNRCPDCNKFASRSDEPHCPECGEVLYEHRDVWEAELEARDLARAQRARVAPLLDFLQWLKYEDPANIATTHGEAWNLREVDKAIDWLGRYREAIEQKVASAASEEVA